MENALPVKLWLKLWADKCHVVHSAFIRFRGLFHRLGLSPHETEVLAIKLETDTNPPSHATLDTTLVQHHVAVHLQRHDQTSLLTGKLHALLQRETVKGRDWYDLPEVSH